jgi:hypothetical protein
VKFVPRRTQIIGRTVIEKRKSTIIQPNETEITKFILVDAVGSEAAAQGIRVGDVVVPKAIGNMVMGERFRPWLEEVHVGFFLTDVVLEEDLLVQTENGKRFVPFDSPEAAQSLGDQMFDRESEVAA